MSPDEPESTPREEPAPTLETAAEVFSEEESSPLRIVPGDKIGPFKVLQLLGEGGFGAVYQCDQEEPVKRRVAVKIIKAGMDTADVVARFQAERQALAMMDHPSIAKVFEAGATPEGRPYFVMEFVKGIPIHDYCSEHKLDMRARLELFTKVCDAVHHAHQKGIIHRDLKPGNILVGTDGGREPRPKIIDFGVAKATSQQLTEQTLFTQLGQMVGTPLYMSPEQAGISSEDIDTRSDVYSLGVVLYQLICGKLPFGPEVLREKGYLEMQRVIREEDPPRPSTQITTQAKQANEETTRIAFERQTSIHDLAKTLKRELEWIPLKALRKDRTERYSTAEALADDVRRYLAGDVLEAGPESASYRLKKLIKRHRGSAIAASLIALSLVAGIIVSLNFAMEADIANQKLQLALEQANQSQLEAEAQTIIAKEQAALAKTKSEEAEASAAAFEEQRDAANLAAEESAALAEFLGEILTSVEPEVSMTLDKALMLQVLTNASQKLDAGEVTVPEVERQLRVHIANAFENIQNFPLSLEQHERIQVLENQLRGEDHPLAVAVGLTRGRLLSWTGAKEEALELWIATRERLLEVEGPDSELSDVASGYIAGALSALGRVEEGLALQEEVLEKRRAKHGPKHPEVLNSLYGLAHNYTASGRFEQSISTWREYKELILEDYDSEDIKVLYVEMQIADIAKAQGDTEGALKLYEELLPRYENSAGPDHPEVANLLSSLARTHFELGKLEEALTTLRRCRTLNEGLYGHSHVFTIGAGSGILACLKGLDRPEEAAEFSHRQMQSYLESIHFGPQHPDTLGMAERTLSLLRFLSESSPEYASEVERYEALVEELAAEAKRSSD